MKRTIGRPVFLSTILNLLIAVSVIDEGFTRGELSGSERINSKDRTDNNNEGYDGSKSCYTYC